jgi:type III pantothenate kinase
MNLVIDLGNTYHKVAVVSNGKILELLRQETITSSDLDNISNRFPLKKAIISSVVEDDHHIFLWLKTHLPYVQMSAQLKLPFTLDYENTITLGTDRIAATVGARGHFPTGNLLVIQAGSCITFDFIDQNHFYRGGSISPGILMRLKSLHQFTGKLPDIPFEPINDFIGNSTKRSILSGVTCGIASEIDGMIDRYREKYEALTVVLTGGTIKYFDKWLKNSNFANSNLVIEGLNTILNIND